MTRLLTPSPLWAQMKGAKVLSSEGVMAKIFLYLGLFFLGMGIIYWIVEKSGFQGLPGDLTFQVKDMQIHFPLMTSLVVSLAISLVLYLMRR